MGKIVFNRDFTDGMAALEPQLEAIHAQQCRLLLDALLGVGSYPDWFVDGDEQLVYSVPDRAMCIQLNRYCRHIDYLQFKIDMKNPLFVLKDFRSVDLVIC